MSNRLVGITRACGHQRGEIFDGLDVVVREQEATQAIDIQLAVRGFSQRTVKKIEAVDIDACDGQWRLRKCRGRPKAASRPTTEVVGGI